MHAWNEVHRASPSWFFHQTLFEHLKLGRYILFVYNTHSLLVYVVNEVLSPPPPINSTDFIIMPHAGGSINLLRSLSMPCLRNILNYPLFACLPVWLHGCIAMRSSYVHHPCLRLSELEMSRLHWREWHWSFSSANNFSLEWWLVLGAWLLEIFCGTPLLYIYISLLLFKPLLPWVVPLLGYRIPNLAACKCCSSRRAKPVHKL